MGNKQQRRLDITGMKSGMLTAITKTGYGTDKDGKRFALWLCKCDCGGEKIVKQHTFVSGGVKSCGCLRNMDYNNIIRHGKSRTRIYRAHNSMKQRCYNPKDQHYPDYGARGIKVCEYWLGKDGFLNFYVWSMQNGYADNLTIDRIDVNGNYEPENCRWATVEQQVNNRRCTKRYDVNGETLLMKEITKKYHISESTLRIRMNKGMTMQEAIDYIRPKSKYSITYKGETKDVIEWSRITGIHKNILVYRIMHNYTEENMFIPVRTLNKKGDN